MATGSPTDAWVSTLNATSAQRRSLAVRLEKGLPRLVGNAKDVVRVRRGKKPHRKANSIGGEFSLIPDPAQTNDPSLEITRAETARFAKIGDAASAAPPIYKYMYLTRGKDWRGWATEDHTRTQFDVPPDIPPRFPFRIPPDYLVPSVTTEDVPPATRSTKVRADWRNLTGDAASGAKGLGNWNVRNYC